ncbi:MAG: hypothetical protein IT529_14610 [Burkholderiales bacterium]|nr:hypothetical protein [Burkholderiales bacterium]
MEHFLLGGLLIGGPIAISGAITIACFVAMFVMLFRRAGWDARNPKHHVPRDDR